jgi:hypothetical protein
MSESFIVKSGVHAFICCKLQGTVWEIPFNSYLYKMFS